MNINRIDTRFSSYIFASQGYKLSHSYVYKTWVYASKDLTQIATYHDWHISNW